MRQRDRETLKRIFDHRCGYCGVSENDVGAELTVDHFQPRSQGGSDEPENWVYCCHPCNEFKSAYWRADSSRQLLHPLRDDIGEHIAEQEDGTLCGLSAKGVLHIETLRLNRHQLVAHRRERRLLQSAHEMQSRQLQRLKRFEKKVQDLTEQLERLKSPDGDD